MQTQINIMANELTYKIQDMLDGFSSGGKFDFNKMEKYFSVRLKSLIAILVASKELALPKK